MSLFISQAFSATNNLPQKSSYPLIIMLIVFGLIFYFMVLRPQQKRVKEHKNLINSISKGDEILMSSGIVGRVNKVKENGYIILLLNDKNEVIIKRDFIAAILPKGTIKSI